ncbi:hypothetical protein RUM44_005832 [Polyplax serrata]|uniref:Vacuolar protein sorting-associated protein 13A n=1 Tax=Polyplax serrata TaxID=468196 RepID=A0ABR1AY66_POLSC
MAVYLEGLAIYWNPDSVLFSDFDSDALTNTLIDSIPKDDYKPQDYYYVFGPLSATAQLQLNPKPENDGSAFNIPKIFVNVSLNEIELGVTHNQFIDIMLFVRNYQRLAAASKYRKYRPIGIPVIGHTKEWWHFAYNAVVEDIRRYKREWSWANIKEHRELCRKYYELYETKLNSRRPSTVVTDELRNLENKLNVFNILLVREQVYVQVERSSQHREGSSSNTGWLTGWFSYGSDKKESNQNELVKKIESVMTLQEKEKLYKAIGYDENAPVDNYPVEFVEVKFQFHLDAIKINILDDLAAPVLPIMSATVKTVKLDFEQRPSASAFKFAIAIGKFQVLGKREDTDNNYPELVTSNCSESESLVEILYETKPLKSSCDQRIHVKALPLSIVYHADTINNVRSVFDTGDDDNISKIMAATSASLPAFQKITAMGLQYAIEKRTIFEVKVNIMPSYLIVPYGGSYNKNKDMLVLMFGKLNVETEESEQKDISVKKLYLEGTSEQEIFSTVVSASYTNFRCELTGVQVLLQLAGEDWVQASNIQGRSPMRFLESTDLVVVVKKSLVTDDARIPKMILEGKLPSLTFNFSEERFIAFAGLVCSIPTNTEPRDLALDMKKGISLSAWSLQSVGAQLENKLMQFPKDQPADMPINYSQGIDLVIHFEMNELMVNVSKSKRKSDSPTRKQSKSQPAEDKFLTLRVIKLEAEITHKTFEIINLIKLGGIEFRQHHKNTILPFVTTAGLANDYYLFVVEFINVNLTAPDFRTERGGIVNRLTLNVTPLNVVLNKEALLAQMAFFTHVQARLNKVKENCGQLKTISASKSKELIWDPCEGQFDKKVMPKGKKFRKKLPKKEIIHLFLDATLEEINIIVDFEGQGLMEFHLQGGSVEISHRKSYTNLDFKLQGILLSDLNSQTIHTKIIESLENKTIAARLTIFNTDYYGTEDAVDMSLEAEVGEIRCIFLNMFFTRLLAFLSAFQVQIQSFKESATVAAQKAKENMIRAYKNTAKICLNVKIHAPLLIIPKESSSLEVLLIDLGTLTVKNHIKELNYPTEEHTSKRPLIDNMQFHLQNLKISRCVLRENMIHFDNEKAFLIPVSFELTIKRNLSTSWFKVIPEFEVLAKLEAVHITLTHEDFSNIATILNTNMGEGKTFAMDIALEPEPNIKSSTKSSPTFEHQRRTDLQEDATEEDNTQLYTSIKFVFYMDRFIFDAFTENRIEVNNTLTKENVGLARFVLETISLKGRKFSDGSIDMSVLLISCLLNDTRPGKEGRLTTLMERTDVNVADQEGDPNSLKSMIQVVFKKTDLDAFVDVRVYKFTLILSMDFLHKLKDFFTVEGLGDENYDTQKSVKQIENKTKLPKNEESPRPPTFTINLRLEKPDIIIVENMDSIDTDALTEILMKYRLAGVRKVISGTLSDIELYSCCFNPAKRRHTLAQVIKPFTISVAGSTPLDQGLHIDICLTEILININPNTVELISKCYEALLSKSHVDKENLNEKDLSDLWNAKEFDPDDYWFFKAEQGEDALTAISSTSSENFSERKATDEICLLAIPTVVILIEGWTAKQSKPLLLMRTGFQFQCNNWSTKLTVTSTLTFQLQYYNKVGAAWEPLIEPVEIQEDKEKKIKHSYVPWEVNFSIAFGDDGYLEAVEPPKVSVTISCSDVLPITLTKTGLDVLKSVVDTYTSAVTRRIVKTIVDLPPFIIKNETGLMAELLLEESNLQVCKTISSQYKIVKLESKSEVELQLKSTRMSLVKSLCCVEGKSGLRLRVQFPISKPIVYELPLNLASKRYYPIPLKQLDAEEVWGLVSDVSIKDNTTVLVLRSTVKVINYFNEPINIHSLSENGTEAEYVGVVEGNSDFSLPFHAVYSSNKKLFFSIKGSCLSTVPFGWEAIKKSTNLSLLMQCTSKNPENNDPFFIQINNYLDKEWSCKETIPDNPSEFFVWKFDSYNGLTPETLNLGVHCTFTRRTAVFTIYCPYVMVNKTDHLLTYRFDGSHTVFYHPRDYKYPIMFSPTFRKFFSKKSAYLKMNDSDWSDKFPVDVAGSGGTVECEDPSTNIIYKVSVTINLTFNSLTKIVTFTPYFVFINETKYIIECQECDSINESWLEIKPGCGTPFWPRSKINSRSIKVRPRGSRAITPSFCYSNTDTCLLRLQDKHGGIFVNIQATQSGTYITYSSYEPGQAPALIINYSAKPIKLYELNTDFEVNLKPHKKIMYAWQCPTGKRKLTVMNPKHMKDEIFLDQDMEGHVCTLKGETVRYVTFLDGIQRILLFTDDLGLSRSITNFLKMTNSGIEVICEIQGIGVSLVNNINCTEILYMGLISSGITWEIKKVGKTRYKRMKQDDIDKMEEAYNRYQHECEIREDIASEVAITDKITVNFSSMKMLQPNLRDLKRTFEPGVWLAYRVMEDQVMLNLKVNKIQVDNQLHDCIFPVILSPVPPPRSVSALYQGSKPFFELSIVKKAGDNSGVEQYKFFEILVQEFHIKIDVGFLQQFWLFLAPEKLSDEEEKARFLKDLELTEKPLISHVEVVSSTEQKNFYEYLHFSPLKIHFSFSLAGSIESGTLPPALSVMIQSVGVTLTDVHDIIFRQLQREVMSHYIGQTVRQAYVLVLGLDVIGNPFGLIVGIGEGVEAFFYEPFQGIIHGPSEFATGVAIGCKSLFGRTVGSTAGTLGKLTETLGKGLAVLSLDKEYQLQRMEHQNRNENIQASMARGGRGLVMGVFEGVTGVVKKPLEGAKEEGVGGFFKGVGKGMMGLVTRPVTGVVDFASTSFNAVKRVTGPSFENKRLRPPRFFREEQLVHPYNLFEALGNAILRAICRRKYCSSDKYEHHIPLRDKEVAILTNKRMILAELNELFGTWQEQMAMTWISMPQKPRCHAKGVAITLPDKNKSSNKGKPDVKVLIIEDEDVKQEVCKKMVELYKLEKEASNQTVTV